MMFSYFTLFVALAISCVAEYYSIVGLTTLFSGAFWPIVIMGVCLAVGKITATVWLKINWHRAPLSYKLYLVPAVITLMFLTAIGCFGFLSKAHSDQSLISGDSQAKITVYDEKIKTSKENIESNRRILKQLDDAVDQVMARSTSEEGAARAVAIRKSQSNDRKRLNAEIQEEQKTIANLNEEVAPLRAENRKIENETGPLKYIAALIYGDNPDANLLESAVRWVIIIIVAVFDPLALVLLLAAQQSYRWERQREAEEEAEQDAAVTEFFEKGRLIARELDREDEQARIVAANVAASEVERQIPEVVIPDPEQDVVAEANAAIAEIEREPVEHIEPEVPKYEAEDAPLTPEQIRQIEYTAEKFKVPNPVESDPTINCFKCSTELINAPGIGPFCPNKACDVMDGPFVEDEEPVKITYVPTKPVVQPEPDTDQMFVSSLGVTVDSDIRLVEPEIVTENVTQEKIMYNYSDNHIIFEGKKMSIDNLRSIRPDLVLPQDGIVPNKIEFGSEFPKTSLNGDTYIRIDSVPHRVYKFNGRKWMAVDKLANPTYLTNTSYLKYLIQRLELNEYDPEFLTSSEQDEIENYLTTKKG